MRLVTTGDTGASPQLACGIVNSADGMKTQNVIFVTGDTGYNQVSLQVALTSGSTTLSPGTIPDPSSPPDPGAGTTLYIDLGALGLPADVWQQMTFDGIGWAFQKFADQRVVGMAPTTSLALSSGTGGAIWIGIHGVDLAAPPPAPQAQVYVTYYNIPDVSGMFTTFAVAIQNAPDQQSDLSDAIDVSLSAHDIVTTIEPLPVAANQFALQFANRQRLVEAGPDTQFSVSFVYGAPHDQYGYGALTSVTRASAFSVVAGDNAEDWTITPDLNAQTVTWTLQPPDQAPIVGTGEQSVVTINFANVVTTYQPGPTVMLVSYGAVPGYQDGTFTLLLDKVPHVVIGSLEVTPNPAYFSDASAAVSVHWQVSNALSLELDQNYQTTPVTGKTALPATLEAASTTFTLKATGRPGTVENSDSRTIQATALPVVHSFTGSPTEIYYGEVSHDVSFAWAVDSPDDIALSSTGGAFDRQPFGPQGHTSASITQTQLVTLEPVPADPVKLTRPLVISAFKPTLQQYPLHFSPYSIAASPADPFVLVAGPQMPLTVLDTGQYGICGTVELGHEPRTLALSADGRTLATVNADQTVSVVGVAPGPTGMPVFGQPSTFTLSGRPQFPVFSSDGSRIYLTLDQGGGAAGQVASLLHTPGGYQVEATVTVGHQPCGLTLDAVGARLFVANLGDGTVTVIGLNKGKLGGTSTIHGLSEPMNVAATPSGKQLLVCCAGDGTVVALDPDHPDLGQRTTLQVGGAPCQLALLAGGSYAAAVNLDGTVSLIDCWGQPRNAHIAGPPLTVSGWTWITASPDGLQVLIAATGGILVVTLATYQATDDAPSIANHPTSVAVSPAGDGVFAWHDTLISASPPIPGIIVYQPSSGTTSNLLAGKYVLGLVAAPDPEVREAFAVVQEDPLLYLIATDTLETSTQPLGLAGSAPVALALSGDGQMLFVVASDASHDLSLVVLEPGDTGWTTVQTLALYRATTPGRFLLRPTPDAATLFLADVATATVRVLRRAGSAYTLAPTVIAGDVSAPDLAILPDGSTAYLLNAGQTTNSITVIDIASLNAHVVAMPSVSLTGLQPAPDGRQLFATDAKAGALRVLDPRSLRILQTIPLATPGTVAGISGLAVMPDGSRIFTVNALSQNLSVVEQIQLGTGPGEDQWRA